MSAVVGDQIEHDKGGDTWEHDSATERRQHVGARPQPGAEDDDRIVSHDHREAQDSDVPGINEGADEVRDVGRGDERTLCERVQDVRS